MSPSSIIRATKCMILLSLCIYTLTARAQSKAEKIDMLLEAIDLDATMDEICMKVFKKYREGFPENQRIQETISSYEQQLKKDLTEHLVLMYKKNLDVDQIDAIIRYNETGKSIAGHQKIFQAVDALLEDELGNSLFKWCKKNMPVMEKSIGSIAKEDPYSIASLYKPKEVFDKLEPYELTNEVTPNTKYVSERSNIEIDFDSSQWVIVDCETEDSVFDVCFETSDGTIFTSVLVEENPMKIQVLKAAALYNLHQGVGEFNMNKVGMVKINDREALKMELEYEYEGDQYVQQNYYLTPSWGAIQIINDGPKDQHDKHQKMIDQFSSGFRVAQ